jgi:dolichol kinase
LFSSADLETRITASFLPALQFIRLGLSGLKKKTTVSNVNGDVVDAKSDFNLADAVSRSGNREEALGGPMIYVTVLFISLLAFFRDSPIGVVAIAQMAVGDGLADIELMDNNLIVGY